MSLLSRRRTEKVYFLVKTKFDPLFVYRQYWKVKFQKVLMDSPFTVYEMSLISCPCRDFSFALLYISLVWSAPSSYSQASVCLLIRAIRDLCRWLRRTYERLLISWCVKTFCQADSASERLGFWCVNRDFLITQVMSISVTWVFSKN